jgi:hypothetical protein
VSIYRQQIFNRGNQNTPEYYTDTGFPVFSQQVSYDLLTGDSGTKTDNFIFTSFIDQNNSVGVPPAAGYYQYSLVISFQSLGGSTDIITVYPGTRTLTAQVVKE